MEARVQRVLIWSGPLMMALWIGAFAALAGFLPPSDPMDSARAIAGLYVDNATAIKLGMVISMAGSALLVPFGVALSGQLKRIDGAKALADTQMVSNALLALEFIIPIGVWMAVAYRADDRAADTTRALHDLGWILFVTVIWSLWVQLLAIGAAVLIDRGGRPVLPRWYGYLTLWESFMILPAGLVLFFKDGAFAWNGLIGIWIPLASYAIWIGATTYCVHRALTLEISEGSEPRLASVGAR